MTCKILGCTRPIGTGVAYVCDDHDDVWMGSGEFNRYESAGCLDLHDDPTLDRIWFTAFNDFVRRIVAEELNSK